MIRKFLPKEEKFFQLFNEIASHLVQSADKLMESLRDPKLIQKRVVEIREIEANADILTHKIIERLHNTFITPFDRQHIVNLVQSLDEVIDLVHAVSERLVIYNLESTPEITLSLALKAEATILEVQKAISCLNQLKNPVKLREICSEIHRLENESDVLFRESLAQLFENENNMKTFIKLKDINEILEAMADRCEDLASLIETIVLEYA